MPLISFICNACGEAFDVFLRLRDVNEASPRCSSCGETDTTAAESAMDELSCGFSIGSPAPT